jgi:hypothetical protein
MCSWVDSIGYKMVKIRGNDNKKHYVRVHRLVAINFIDNPYNYKMVNHKNGIKTCNDYKNLEWCTNSYNTKHAYDNGAYLSHRRSYRVDVFEKETNKLVGEYKSVRSMCEDLHINRKTVGSIMKGEKKTNNYKYTFKYKFEG